MKIGRPLDGHPTEYISIDGAVYSRCQAVNIRIGSGQCAKPSTHKSAGDKTHYSESAFCWMDDEDQPIEYAEDRFDPTAASLLAGWWRETAEAEIDQTVAKAVEYGATDLVDIGRTLGRVAGRELNDQDAAEWGVFFYLEGKLSRWRSAIERGDRPSEDTLLDIGVYARMAQRIRQVGAWPGVEEDK